MDKAERRFGQVTVTVEAEPIVGNAPPWTNVIEIAEECINKIVMPRYERYQDSIREEMTDG